MTLYKAPEFVEVNLDIIIFNCSSQTGIRGEPGLPGPSGPPGPVGAPGSTSGQ